jgi:hypothetical protein
MNIQQIDKSKLTQYVEKYRINDVLLSSAILNEFLSHVAYGIFSKDNQLKGIFITQSFKRLKFFETISCPDFFPNCRLHIVTNSKNKAKINSELKKVMQVISDYLPQQKSSIISLNFPENYVDFQPFIWNKYKVITNYTYQLDLNKTKQSLFQEMSPERRKNILKAEKDGITVKEVIPNQEVWRLIKGTYDKLNKEVNFKVIKALLNNSDVEKNSICHVAYNKSNKAIACNFCLYDTEKVLYMFGGFSPQSKHEGAGALAMWSSIKLAKEKKINIFDFEGSMIPKVENYFRGFGGSLVPYFQVNKAKLGLELILKLKERTKF